MASLKDQSDLLWADLQSSSGKNELLRLGSGRSAFYQGAYLKGIGRTSLAANWNDTSDIYHGTGHMYASPAVREYISSVFLKAQGLEYTIVPCTDFLLRPMDSDFYQGHLSLCEQRQYDMPLVDKTLQAITVKPGDFARPGNIVWLLSRMSPQADQLITLCHCLMNWSLPPSQNHQTHQVTPSAVIEAINFGIYQGVRNIQLHNQLGLFWGSIMNNYALDGRFLDLENATFIAPGLVGEFVSQGQSPVCATPNAMRDRSPSILGMEVLGYAKASRDFVLRIKVELQRLYSEAIDDTCKSWLSQMLQAWESVFSPGSLLFNTAVLKEMAIAPYIERGGNMEIASQLADLLLSDLGLNSSESEDMMPDLHNIQWTLLEKSIPQPEPIAKVDIWCPSWQGESTFQADWSLADTVNQKIFEAFEMTEPQSVMSLVSEIEQYFEQTLG
ncbi:MAG: hypothetical protein HC810_08320 [Acaryochloridaceae cyanobacterium RL_2_7]|nr:hypothetical protein [Acaryochloridaceae cyanobacterium RL_2_7]